MDVLLTDLKKFSAKKIKSDDPYLNELLYGDMLTEKSRIQANIMFNRHCENVYKYYLKMNGDIGYVFFLFTGKKAKLKVKSGEEKLALWRITALIFLHHLDILKKSNCSTNN